MGRRGPKPKPTAMLKLSGSTWVNETRAGRGNEPKPEVSEPKCPVWLKDRSAKAHWKRLVKELVLIDVLTVVDGDALARLCITYSRFIEAQTMLSEEGQVIESEKGGQIRSPWSKIAEITGAQLLRLEQEFGLTPSSRARVQTVAKKEVDKNRQSKEAYFG